MPIKARESPTDGEMLVPKGESGQRGQKRHAAVSPAVVKLRIKF